MTQINQNSEEENKKDAPKTIIVGAGGSVSSIGEILKKQIAEKTGMNIIVIDTNTEEGMKTLKEEIAKNNPNLKSFDGIMKPEPIPFRNYRGYAELAEPMKVIDFPKPSNPFPSSKRPNGRKGKKRWN